MKYKRLVFILVAMVSGFFWFTQPKKKFLPPFEEAQTLSSYSKEEVSLFYRRLSKKKWKTIHRLYKRNLGGKQRRHKYARIPKIIHQICLEENQAVLANHESWKEAHPDWECYLWTEEELKYLYLINQTLYEKASSSEEKIQIAAFEILYQYGGVFIDSDLVCKKNLDFLNEHCDFYAPLKRKIKRPELSTKIIGCSPSHPILNESIRTLRRKTATIALTQSFFHNLKKRKPQANVALPTSFFLEEPYFFATEQI